MNENDPLLPPFASVSLPEYISRCTTADEISTQINNALTLIESTLAQKSNEVDVIEEAFELLISLDRHLETWLEQNGTFQEVFTELWKKLIGFLKNYHTFIHRHQAHRLLQLFVEHALVHVKILSAIYATRISSSVESSSLITTTAFLEEFMPHVGALTFYCQRISAILSFCSSNLSGDDILVSSLEVLFYFRGIISLMGTSVLAAANDNYNHFHAEYVNKSEDYVRKAMRGPPNGTQECDTLDFNLFERAGSIDLSESIFGGQHDLGRTQAECAMDMYVKTVGATFSACHELQNDHISSFHSNIKPRCLDVIIRSVTKLVVYGRSSAIGNDAILVSVLECCCASMGRILTTQAGTLDQARPLLTTTLMVRLILHVSLCMMTLKLCTSFTFSNTLKTHILCPDPLTVSVYHFIYFIVENPVYLLIFFDLMQFCSSNG